MHNVTQRLRDRAASFSGWAGGVAALLALAAGVIMGAYPTVPGPQVVANEAYTLVLTASPDVTQVAYGESVEFTATVRCNDPDGPATNVVRIKVTAGQGDDASGIGSASTTVMGDEHGPNMIAVTASDGGLTNSRSIDVIRVTVGAGSTDCVHTASAQMAINTNLSYSPAGYDWTIDSDTGFDPNPTKDGVIFEYSPRASEPGIYKVTATSKNLWRCHDETNAVVFKVAITGEDGPLLAVGNTAAYTAVVTPELSGTYAWSVTGGGLGIEGDNTDKSVMVTGLTGSVSIDAECLKVVFSPPSASCMAETNLTVIKVDIEPVEMNVCGRMTNAALNLTADSYLGGGSATWSSVPSGISGSGTSVTFNPSLLTPGIYVVTAASSVLPDCKDVCTVGVYKVTFKVVSDNPGTEELTDNRKTTATITVVGHSNPSSLSFTWDAKPIHTNVINKAGTAVSFTATADPLVWRTSEVYWYGVPPDLEGWASE